MAVQPKDDRRKFGLSELITIGSIIVTISLAWGVFGTRLTVLENDNQQMKVQIQEIRQSMQIHDQIHQKIEQRIRENETAMEELWRRGRSTK